MNSNNLREILNILDNNQVCHEDNEKIENVSIKLKKFEEELPTTEVLEEIKKEITDLEVKYDQFNELSYYFDPLYLEIKKNINELEVKKLREKNKKKAGEN